MSLVWQTDGAIWVNDRQLPLRVLYFIVQHLTLVLPKSEIVDNMHQAYERLRFDNAEFGTFIAGPSKTADIEQSLVIGPHGSRSLTVLIIDRNAAAVNSNDGGAASQSTAIPS